MTNETNIIHFDFKAGRRLTASESFNQIQEVLLQKQELAGKYQKKFEKIRSKKKIQDTPEFDESVFDKISARYGDDQPRGGVLYTSAITQDGPTTYVDTYGRGCVHNCIQSNSKLAGGGYWRELGTKHGYWNRPMPFPAHPILTLQELQEKNIDTIVLNHKSDGFMWMDQKYGITKAFLRYAADFGIKNICIDTRSDLVATETYRELLMNFVKIPENSLKINIIYWAETEEISRIIEPGCPSLKRRREAVDRLLQDGLNAEYLKEKNFKITDEAMLREFGHKDQRALETIEMKLNRKFT